MTRKQRSAASRKISAELSTAISADEAGCPTESSPLRPNDIATLKRILLEKPSLNTAVNRKRAIFALACSERSAAATKILSGILANPKESLRVRAAAASQLSLMPPDRAEPSLLRNLTTKDEVLRAQILKSLAQIGSKRSLERLRTTARAHGHSAKVLAFAKLAIALRSGDDNARENNVNKVMGIGWAIEPAKLMRGRESQERLSSLRGPTYGVRLNPEMAFSARCGLLNLFFFLNNDIKSGRFLEPLRSGSIIAGIIALEEKHTRHLTVRYLILKTPNRAGAQLTVLNTNGEVAYVGNAQPNGEEFRFSLRDVGSERLATQIEGTISEDAMNFEVRVWRGTPRPKNRPLAMATTGGKSSECPTCVRRR